MITKKIARGGSFEGFFTAGQLIGSSSSKVYYKKDVSKQFTGKYLCWRLFLIKIPPMAALKTPLSTIFNKIAGIQLVTLSKSASVFL